MDLRQLRYFLVVAEERSVTAAAAPLHLTRPPLSAQQARLEHELGVTLLVRHRRGVDLTAAGRDLVEHARHLLADGDTAAESVRRIGQGRSGRLALMFTRDPRPAGAALPAAGAGEPGGHLTCPPVRLRRRAPEREPPARAEHNCDHQRVTRQ